MEEFLVLIITLFVGSVIAWVHSKYQERQMLKSLHYKELIYT